MVGVAAVVAAFALAPRFIGGDDPAPAPRVTPERTEAQKESAWIAEMQVRVQRGLKDPSSAQFRGDYVSRKSGSPVVCGEVNSNNSYGGKTGFQRYVAAGSITAIAEQMGAGEMEKLWQQVC